MRKNGTKKHNPRNYGWAVSKDPRDLGAAASGRRSDLPTRVAKQKRQSRESEASLSWPLLPSRRGGRVLKISCRIVSGCIERRRGPHGEPTGLWVPLLCHCRGFFCPRYISHASYIQLKAQQTSALANAREHGPGAQGQLSCSTGHMDRSLAKVG